MSPTLFLGSSCFTRSKLLNNKIGTKLMTMIQQLLGYILNQPIHFSDNLSETSIPKDIQPLTPTMIIMVMMKMTMLMKKMKMTMMKMTMLMMKMAMLMMKMTHLAMSL